MNDQKSTIFTKTCVMTIKKLKVLLLFFSGILYSCSQNNFEEVKNISEIEYTTTSSTQEKYTFLNTKTNQKVSILHHLQQTGFHFYNSLQFKNENTGVLVGGTGLRTRITTDGGKTWKEHSFSRFANSFHSVAFSGKALYIVGESKYIFKSTDLGESWVVFNTEQFFKEKSFISQFKYYKIHFFNDETGFITGDYNGKPIMLKTTDGGETWDINNPKGFDSERAIITDFKILSEKEIIAVTQYGECYKSINQGADWRLLYTSKNKNENLNSIDFKNSNTGYIGGLNGKLLCTVDGGKTWNTIVLPKVSSKSNVSDILYVKNQVIITTAVGFNDKERRSFVYSLDEKENTIQPFLTKKDSAVFFAGNSYGLTLLNDQLYILDRNNLYKTFVKAKK